MVKITKPKNNNNNNWQANLKNFTEKCVQTSVLDKRQKKSLLSSFKCLDFKRSLEKETGHLPDGGVGTAGANL